MSEAVALVVEGTLENVTELILGDGLGGCRPYPEGQNLRGAFGYALLDAGAELVESYREDRPAVIYFRDARPLHRMDGGELQPHALPKNRVDYQCSRCGHSFGSVPTRLSRILGIRMDRQRRTAARGALATHTGVVSGERFAFRAALNLKRAPEGAEEQFAMAVEMFREHGLRLGRRRNKGKGLLVLRNVRYRRITVSDLKRRARELRAGGSTLTLHFLADVITGNGETVTSPSLLLRSIKKMGRFAHPEYEPYRDPFVRIRGKTVLPEKTLLLMDRKRGIRTKITRHRAVPRGSSVTLEIRDAPDMFWECLALTEAVAGAGARAAFGKGEFAVLPARP